MNQHIPTPNLIENIEPVFDDKSPDDFKSHFMGEELISVNGLTGITSRDYLVKDLLLFGQVSMLAGPPNMGKTSIIASIAAHAALGEPLGNRKVAHAATLYVAAEDPQGVAERGAAVLRQRRNEALPFDIFPKSLDLTESSVMDWFSKAVGDYKASRSIDKLFLVFDTLNLCLGDGDENSSRDMGRAISNAQKIARQHNAHVMIVHHATHSDPEKPRGSSAMIGNCDTLLILNEARTKTGEAVIALHQRKQRSLMRGDPLLFKLTAVEVGHDTDGDPITMPVALHCDDGTDIVAALKSKDKKGLDERAEHLLDLLRQKEAESTGGFHSLQTLRDEVTGPFQVLLSKPESLRKALARAREVLMTAKLIEVADDGTLRVKT